MKQVFPDASPRPADKAIIDRGVRPILRRQVAPAAACLQHVHNAAYHTTVINTLLSSNICGQQRVNPGPLLVRSQYKFDRIPLLPEAG